MFTPVESDLIGRRMAYLPKGYSPWKPNYEIEAVLYVGDYVTVESAWNRDYLSPDSPTLYFVRSERTGEAAHVREYDLIHE